MAQDASKAIADFDQKAEQINRSFLDSLEKRGTPETIYHYTDDNGLRGILESGTLWLSDIFSLNDPSELHHGFSHAIKILEAKADPRSPVSKELADIIGEFHKSGKTRESGHFLTCSFSLDGDELGQWRAYADNGRGYALAFDTESLERAFVTKDRSGFAQTFPLTYDDNALVHLLDQIIEPGLALADFPIDANLHGSDADGLKLALLNSLRVHSLHSAIFFKHPAYANEKEYRFLEMFPLRSLPSDVKVRTRPYSLVRYREFGWRVIVPDALQGIRVGPAADPERATQFATDCLRTFHGGDVSIAESTIPYRAL